MKERITKKQALRAVRAKLPLLGDKKLQENLDFVVGGCCSRCTEARVLAEAYRIGAAEAQGLIAKRIEDIKMKKPVAKLIESSSIGAGLRDIKERGIDAHTADLERELGELPAEFGGNK